MTEKRKGRADRLLPRIAALALTLALPLAAALTLSACGNGDPEIAEPEWDNDGMGFSAEYDYGIEVTGEGTMLGALQKLDYSDIGGSEDELKEMTEACIEDAKLGSYELMTGFDKLDVSPEEARENGYEIGDIVYCTGSEEENLDLGMLEVAAYENPSREDFGQYIIYYTGSYFGSGNVNADELAELFEKAFGIRIDPSKIRQSAELLEKKAMSARAEEEAGEGEDIEIVDGEGSDEDGSGEDDGAEDDGGTHELTDGETGGDNDFIDETGEEAEVFPESGDVEIIGEDGEVIDLSEQEDIEDFEFSDGEDEDYYMPCFLRQTVDYKGDGYTDSIILSMIGEYRGEDEVAIYGGIEIYRTYDNQ